MILNRKRRRIKRSLRELNKHIRDEYGVEFTSKKGQVQNLNQDNMFIIITDSKVGVLKIFGVFDGHGPFGHKVSKYVQSRLLTHHITK